MFDTTYSSGIRTSACRRLFLSTSLPLQVAPEGAASSDGVEVSLGVVGLGVSMATRKKMARLCGVAPPENGFSTPFWRRLARWHAQRGEAEGAQALHLYPFGGLRKCLAKMHTFTNDDSVSYGPGRAGEPRGPPRPYANFQMQPPVPDAFASGDRPAP